MPVPPSVLKVVVKAPVLLQNTTAFQSFGTITFLLPVSTPVVVRYPHLALSAVKETAGVTTFADCELAWTNLPTAVRPKRYLWSGPYMRIKEERFHPTQKPFPVMEWCIERAGKISSVLDPYMGSGTTGVACARMGRAFTGIERERKYFDIACERIARAQSQGQLLPPEPVAAPEQQTMEL